MATEIKLPVLGENVDSGTVVKILVSPGDTVTQDQPVLDLDTDKASVEVPASAAGKVRDIRVKEGDTVKVGQVILTLDGNGAAETQEAGKKAPQPANEPANDPAKKTEAEKKPADKPQPKESKPKESKSKPIEELEEKADAQEKEEEAAGGEAKPAAAESKPAERPRADARDAGKEPAGDDEASVREGSGDPAPAAPSLRRMARELGIDINAVSGSGPGGRISDADIRNYARSIILNSSGAKSSTSAEGLPDFNKWGAVERKSMSPVRRKTAEHLHNAWNAVPHVTQFDSADITELEKMRVGFSKKVQDAGGKLTVTAIALKIAAAALKVFPQFNASIDMESEEVVYKKYVNIGVAVDTDRGLLVPVIRDVDKKNVRDLSVEIAALADKARNRKLGIEDMQGGCFTITNLGGIGGTSFTPIVNNPEVAILGLSRSSQQPVFVNGQFVPRLMLPLSLSYDHRLIDGADGARFLRWVVEALEQPFLLTLEG